MRIFRGSISVSVGRFCVRIKKNSLLSKRILVSKKNRLYSASDVEDSTCSSNVFEDAN